jgi:hypothetical protein
VCVCVCFGLNCWPLPRALTHAVQVTKQIRDQERGGNATIAIIEEGRDNDNDFWLKFGCPRPARIRPAEQGGADEDVHSRTAANAKLYRIAASSDGAGSVKVRVCVCGSCFSLLPHLTRFSSRLTCSRR